MSNSSDWKFTRREVLKLGAASVGALAATSLPAAPAMDGGRKPVTASVAMDINGKPKHLGWIPAPRCSMRFASTCI